MITPASINFSPTKPSLYTWYTTKYSCEFYFVKWRTNLTDFGLFENFWIMDFPRMIYQWAQSHFMLLIFGFFGDPRCFSKFRTVLTCFLKERHGETNQTKSIPDIFLFSALFRCSAKRCRSGYSMLWWGKPSTENLVHEVFRGNKHCWKSSTVPTQGYSLQTSFP